jgi:spermidine/putrescine-binding protein
MKKTLSLTLCILIIFATVLSTASCGGKKIALTSDNYDDYIMINVEITNFRKEKTSEYITKYYAEIIIETDRAANVEFEGAKLKSTSSSSSSGSALAKLRAAKAGDSGKGMQIDLNYLGKSRTSFTYSSTIDFSKTYSSIISSYKTGWDVEGYVIIP